MKKAIFPGTFDPFTIGHFSIVKRALTFMDEIIIGIGVNDKKRTWFPMEKRVKMIQELYEKEPRIKVQSYNGLTVDFAQEQSAKFIIRGIRTVHDFEYEETIADVNRKLSGIETILLFTEPELTLLVLQLSVNCYNLGKT
jgi:pantetheine-phosphate adenylyltransferase